MKAILDVHCHTIVSGHAYSTLEENIKGAKKNGVKYLGISDHAPNMPGGPHPFYFQNMHVIPRRVDGVAILRGIEANIIDYNGSIDVDQEILGRLDYVIASLHRPCIEPGTKEENTNAILKVMDEPKVKIIGHLDDSGFPVDYEPIIKKAKERNVLLEINNSSLNTGSYRTGVKDNLKVLLEYCKKYDAKVILGSDSHISYTIGKFDNCKGVLEEVEFPDKLIINYYEDEIVDFFGINF